MNLAEDRDLSSVYDSVRKVRNRLGKELIDAAIGEDHRTAKRRRERTATVADESAAQETRNPLEALEAQDRAGWEIEQLSSHLTPAEAEVLTMLAPHLLAGLSVNRAARLVGEETGRSAHTVRGLYRRAKIKYESIQNSA